MTWDGEREWNRAEEAEKRRLAYWRKRKRTDFWEAFIGYGVIVVVGGVFVLLLSVPYLP